LPLAQDPASFLASLITVQRDASMPYEVRIAAQDFLTAVCEREDRILRDDPHINDDQMREHAMAGLTPLIPGRADLRDRVNGTRMPNGKERGHL
jgi:hypothetical protein